MKTNPIYLVYLIVVIAISAVAGNAFFTNKSCAELITDAAGDYQATQTAMNSPTCKTGQALTEASQKMVDSVTGN